MAVRPDRATYDDRAHDPLSAGDLARRSSSVVRRADGAWEVLGHAEVVEAARDATRFSSQVSAHLQLPNGLDGDEHRAYRALIDRYFTPERISALEPTIRAVARELVDELLRAGREGSGALTLDAVADLGAPFAVRAQTRWLGWPESLEPEMLQWIRDNQAASRGGSPAEKAEVARRFDEIIRSVVAPRRAAPDGAPADVTSELMNDDFLGRPLSDEELVSVLRNWTAGDLGSLARCVGVILQFLATHPAVQDRVRLGVSRRELEAIIDEILRIDDPFVSSRRVTTCPVELGGVRLEAGERVRLNWTSANRDEDALDDPQAFDPVANGPHNLVYGVGPHHCPGRSLATTELCILVEELVAAAAPIETSPDADPIRAESPAGGYARVPLLIRPHTA